jgi:hypothetical protein
VSNLIYLVVAVAASIVGSLVLWFRSRKPTSVESRIDEFHRGLQALSPEGVPSTTGWRNRRRAR